MINKYRFSFLLILSAMFFHVGIFGQVFKPIKWTFTTEKISDNTVYLVFSAKADKGWNVYSQFTDDNGPVPTSINYENKSNISFEGKALEFGHKKEGPDPLFDGVNVIKFLPDQPFVIKQKIKINDDSKIVSGYLTFMTCNDERCLPPEDVDFSFKINNFEIAQANNISETPKYPIENHEPYQQTKPIIVSKTKSDISPSVDKTHITNAELNNKQISSNNTIQNLENPVKWIISKNKSSDNEYDLIFTANIENGWNIYSTKTSVEGPIPTSITFESREGFELIGKAIEKGTKKEGKDPLFGGIKVIKYLSDLPYSLTQRVKIYDDQKPIKGYLTYMACNSEKCLPPTDVDFDLSINSPTSISKLDTRKIENGVIDQLVPSIYHSFKNPINDCGKTKIIQTGILWTFLFGFLGGLVALLTPCVFPMIPITVSFFTKDTKRKGWVNGLIYGISIIVIYVILGLLITILFGPEALNRLSTNWIANTLFFLIFIFFAFSFFGFYEITLPSSWSTKSDRMADKGGLLGIFFMAFTLALVSFSCTGPIIGSALVQAAGKGEYLGPFFVMFGFSLALALPFGIFAAFPAWLNSLPRSGSWMNSVKVVLGFLELALAFKFLSVADMTNHWGILKYELFMFIWVLVFLGMALYLWGFIKFPHDSPLKKRSSIRAGFAILATFLTLYLISGFRYNDKTKNYSALSLLSGLAPPAHYNFFLEKGKLDPSILSKYSSYTKCANDIPCFKDYYQGLSYAKESQKPIMIDFTGHGCVNCRKTEEHIWIDDKVRNILTNELVLISLYVDDDKKLDEVLLAKQSQKKLRNIGNQWADFQIVNFEQNSQPLYVVMTNDEQVLASPRGYEEGVNEYYSFLNCALSKK